MHLNSKLLIHGLDGRDFETDILSYYLGHTQSDARAAFQDFGFTRHLDRHSPRLARACAEGTHFDRATLRSTDREGRRVLEYRLSDCQVSTFQCGGSVGDDGTPVDNMSLNYSRIEWVCFDPETGEEFAERADLRSLAGPAGAGAVADRPPPAAVPNTAFVVMWMDPDHPELDDVCNAIKEVCRQFGVAAVRADDIEHSDQITELVLAKIASSEFIIADLTGERPNVYYEVGYAQAVGKRPILVRRHDTRVHFDLSVHNVRAYKNITQLKDLLTKRFEAIMGRSAGG